MENTTKASVSQGSIGVTVDGETWQLRRTLTPLGEGQLAIEIPDKNAGHELLHILEPSA